MICQHLWFRQQLQLTACSTVGRRDNFANSSANSYTITVGYDPVNLRIANSKTPENCVPQTSVGSHTKCWQLCFIRWREFVGLYIWRGYTDVNPSKEKKCWQERAATVCCLIKVLAEPRRSTFKRSWLCANLENSDSSMMELQLLGKHVLRANKQGINTDWKVFLDLNLLPLGKSPQSRIFSNVPVAKSA